MLIVPAIITLSFILDWAIFRDVLYLQCKHTYNTTDSLVSQRTYTGILI